MDLNRPVRRIQEWSKEKTTELIDRDELLASKDKIIELLEGKVEKLESELTIKKAPGGATKTHKMKILHYPVEAI